MIYIDSNIFIYACLNADEMGERSRNLLKSVEHGDVDAASTSLSFDEIVWAVKKYRTVEQAISAGEAFINMPRLNLVVVDETVIRYAIDLMKRYTFDPRDAIHAASALLCRAESLISSDPHFDRLKELPRRFF
jgi:hypothetical protein